MSVYYEVILAKTELGDLEIEECKTLREARKKLKMMIGGKPYHDAYIRKFRYNDAFEDYEAIKDYELK